MSLPQRIDVWFDFTEDTPHFWDGYWDNNNGFGGGSNDPDSSSKTLQCYHKLLWSKELPSGETMCLTAGTGSNYLTWRDFRFGSDSITASFRYVRYLEMLGKVRNSIQDYKSYMENYTRKTYTIGGEIIFPKWHGGINQSRGCNPYIRDRWDLTLECIRLYYENRNSPLYNVLKKDEAFFNLFVDFKGYIDFFFLQDCVTANYKIKFLIGNGEFAENPLPKTVDEYFQWMNKQLEFVQNRNKRIENYLSKK